MINNAKFFKLKNENLQLPDNNLCSDVADYIIEISVDDRSNYIAYDDCNYKIDSEVIELSNYLRELAAD